MYKVFVRNWWQNNPKWPNGLEPDPTAPKKTLATRIETEATARMICKAYNSTHKPGRLSRKAEYMET